MESLTKDELNRRAKKVLDSITPEEDEDVRQKLNTPATLEIDTNEADAHLIEILAPQTGMTARELASKLFEKSLREFAQYVATIKLAEMGD